MAEKGASETAARLQIGSQTVDRGLAVPVHSTIDMEEWEEVHFREDEARENAKVARDAYKDALRKPGLGVDS
jgi:hypothetical protein